MKPAPKEGTQFRPAPGDAVVLRGLPRNPKTTINGTLTPRIGLVRRVLTGGRFAIALRFGGIAARRRWCPRVRIVDGAHVERLATAREIVVGLVLLPAVSS
jgi:hypothetical protein